MCDILHKRQVKFYLRFDMLFKLSGFQDKQDKFLATIHGLTKKVIKQKRAIFEKTYGGDKVPSPSLSEIIAGKSMEEDKPKRISDLANPGIKTLRDDLDDNDENDVGKDING